MPEYTVNIQWEDENGELVTDQATASSEEGVDDGILVVPGSMFVRAGSSLPAIGRLGYDVTKVDADYHLQFKSIDLLSSLTIHLELLQEWIEAPAQRQRCGEAHTITKFCRAIEGGCLGFKLERHLSLEGDSEDFDDAEYFVWRGGL